MHCLGIAVLPGFANSVGFGGFAADLAGLPAYANPIAFGGLALGFAGHLATSLAGSASYFADFAHSVVFVGFAAGLAAYFAACFAGFANSIGIADFAGSAKSIVAEADVTYLYIGTLSVGWTSRTKPDHTITYRVCCSSTWPPAASIRAISFCRSAICSCM